MKTTRKPILVLGVALSISLFLSGCASRPGTATVYRPAGIFGGYVDEMVALGVWEVTGRSNGIAEPGFGRNMALYRAAEVVGAAGFSHFEVIDQDGTVSMVGIGYGNANNYAGESLELLVRGKMDSSPPTECRAENEAVCFTVAVDEVISRIEPQLFFPRGDPRRPPDPVEE